MTHFNCVIIDDDEIDRLTVVSYAKRIPNLTIVGIFESAVEAAATINEQPIDILFLDIDMPGENGLAFRKKMLEVPVCIFITSHPEHAVESFELETLDFIVKPFKFQRFEPISRRKNAKFCGFSEQTNLERFLLRERWKCHHFFDGNRKFHLSRSTSSCCKKIRNRD